MAFAISPSGLFSLSNDIVENIGDGEEGKRMIKGRSGLYILVFLFLLLLAGCQSSKGETEKEKSELVISAAASLQKALTEIEADYEEANEDISLILNLSKTF